MEQGRFKQINDLKAQGWKRNYKLVHDHPNSGVLGEPSIMENPDGLLYTISCGTEKLHTGPLYEKFTGNTVTVDNGKIVKENQNS